MSNIGIATAIIASESPTPQPRIGLRASQEQIFFTDLSSDEQQMLLKKSEIDFKVIMMSLAGEFCILLLPLTLTFVVLAFARTQGWIFGDWELAYRSHPFILLSTVVKWSAYICVFGMLFVAVLNIMACILGRHVIVRLKRCCDTVRGATAGAGAAAAAVGRE